MRVLILVPTRSDPAHRRVLRSLRREFSRAGDRVSVFPPRDGLSPARSRRELARLLAQRRPDACLIQHFSRGLGWLGAARFPAGLRLVLAHQGASLDLLEDRASFRTLARRADRVTCVSRDGLRKLRVQLPELRAKSSYVPNGADIPRAPRRAGPAPRRPFILSVARLAAYKGTDVLLMAFAGLARERPDLDLVICGPDQSGGGLPRFAARLGLGARVRMLGSVSAARVASLLERCVFFALPSREENMPMALLEAMAAGKASAASRAGGIPEVSRHGLEALLVAPGDAAALERALRRLSEDAALRRRLGAAAARRARAFSWRAAAARYRRLCAGGESAQKSQVRG
jgi:glycosyltransferase involved in cell wall biosynthesis